MSCQVIFNDNGSIRRVNTPTGEESQLFNQISKLPHVESLEDALEIYKNKYKDGVSDEAPLNFISDRGNSFNTFREALLDSDSGNIQILSNDLELLNISSNTNVETTQGLVNNLIKDNILSDEKVVDNGNTFYKASGYDVLKQLSNENEIKLSKAGIKVHKDGRIEIKDKKDSKDTPKKKLLQDILSNTFGVKKGVLTEEDLKNRLFEFLNSIGVTITSIENYTKKYKIRNGVDISAQALADFSNQVIAFREGKVSTEVLTEETAHFIVEGWNSEDIDGLLRNIHKTESYLEHSEKYREIYQKEYPGEDVENLVRREILGKELAKALQSRFSLENKTETQGNIIKRLYNLLLDFFDKILLQDNYKEKLDFLTDKVEDMLLNKDISNYINTDQIINKKFRLYSVTSTNNPHHALIRALQEQERVLIRLGKGSSDQMKSLQDYLSQQMEKSTVRNLINLANRQTRYIIEAIKEADSRGRTLTVEENIVFQNLKNVISPALSLLKVSIEGDTSYRSEVIDAENTIKNISDMIGEHLRSDNEIVETIVDRVIKRAGKDIRLDENGNFKEDETIRKEITDLIKTAKKDTNGIFSYFGQISNAQDPLLNLLSTVISDLTTETEQMFQEKVKDFQTEMRNLGYKEADLKKIVGEDGYVISQWDFAELEDFIKYARAQAYKDNLADIISDLEKRGGKETELNNHKSFLNLSDKQFLEKFEDIPEISNTILFEKVRTQSQKYQSLGTESFLSDEFINKQEERLKGLSEETKAVLKSFSQLKAQVRRSMRKSKNGIPIYTIQNKLDLDTISSLRASKMSPYNDNGGLKQGLIITSTPLQNSIELGNSGEFLSIDMSKASTEAVVSFELHKYNKSFIDEIKSKGGFNEGITDSWSKELSDMESDKEIKREDIISWFNLNTTVGFSNKFFDSKTESLVKQYENDPEIEEAVIRQKQLLTERKNILNQYKDSRSSVNTMANLMPQEVKKRIKDLTFELEIQNSIIFRHISKKDGFVKEESLKTAETRPNESYYKQLEDSNITTIEEKLSFTKENMTDFSRLSVEEFEEAVRKGEFNKKTQKIVDKYGDTKESVLRYAESKLLPYYTSYAPTALQNFYDKIRNTNEPLSKLVEELNKSEDVRLSVSYEYLDKTDESILNPNRLKDYKGGVIQPSLIKKPNLFGRTFDFNNKNWDKIDKDVNLKKLHDLYVNFKSDAHQLMDYEEGNVYLLPQVPETTIQRIAGIFSGNVSERVKETLDEIKNYRVGDLAEGELDEEGNPFYSSSIKIIPRYFTRKLERKENVSTDIFYSSAMMMNQAILRNNRVKYYGEISALMDAISNNTRYAGIGKQASATNTYKMAQSFIDNAIFGIEDVARARMNLPVFGEVDVTKTIKLIHRWKQNLSLALNPIVPATSFITAKAGLVGETLVSQYLDSDSFIKGNKLFYSKGFKGKADALDVYSEQEAVVIMEHLGLLHLTNRFKDSKYNRVTRLVGNASYGLHQMADYPIKGSVAYSVMVGHKVFNGKIFNFSEYSRILSQAGKSKQEIKNTWQNLNTLYDYVEIKDGKFSYKDSLREEVPNIDDFEKIVITRAKQLSQRVDGAIRDEERTYAQRHYALRYTMTHRGWLVLALANRFKGRHLNMQTGIYEEGTYRTLGKLVTKTLNSLYNRDISEVKSAWLNMSQEDKINMQRIYKEASVLGAIYGLMLMFAGFADDDEDDLSKQALAYLFERVSNETISSQAGVVKELYSSVKEPVVGIQQILEIPKVHKLLTGDEIVKSGRYHGMTERERWLIKNIVGVKPAYDLWNAKNLKSQRDSYNHFSGESDDWNPFSYIISKDEYLEED